MLTYTQVPPEARELLRPAALGAPQPQGLARPYWGSVAGGRVTAAEQVTREPGSAGMMFMY